MCWIQPVSHSFPQALYSECLLFHRRTVQKTFSGCRTQKKGFSSAVSPPMQWICNKTYIRFTPQHYHFGYSHHPCDFFLFVFNPDKTNAAFWQRVPWHNSSSLWRQMFPFLSFKFHILTEYPFVCVIWESQNWIFHSLLSMPYIIL